MKLLQNLRIGAKIYAVVAILSALTLAVSLFMSRTITDIDARYSSMLENDVTFALKLERMRGDLANMGRQMNNVLLLQDPSGLPALTKAIGDIQTAVAESGGIIARLAKPERKDAVNRLSALVASVKATLPKVYAAKEKGDHTEAAALYGKEGRPLLVEVYSIAATLSDEVVTGVDRRSQALSDQSSRTVVIATTTAVGLIALVGVLSVLLVIVGIRRPLTALNGVMERLAAGDAAAIVTGTDRGDELGAMARTVEVFKDNMLRARQLEEEAKQAELQAAAEKRANTLALARSFEDRVGAIVNAVGSSATELQATSSQLAVTVDQVSAQCANVAAASEQASANVQTVAAASEELSASINDLSDRVARAADRSKRAAEGASEAQRQLDQLSSAIDQVDQIVAAINAVASQTNLLALNATIEAARAGEAGKGFAVVASEVKNLANQTHAMTEQITNQISAVKSASDRTVGAMRTIIGQVEDISSSTADMASSVSQQSSATVEISRNAQQAAIGTTEVSRNVQGIQVAGNETGGKHPPSAAVRPLSSARGLPSSSRAAVRAGGFGGCR